MLDKERFYSVFVPFLKDFCPDVVVLQVGKNDVINTDTMVQAILIASEMEELTLKLINEFCVKLVFIVKFLRGNGVKKTSPNRYAQQREDTMKYLETLVQHEPRIQIW